MGLTSGAGLSGPRWWAGVASILVLASVTRLFGLGANALWIDEAYSVWFSDQDWHYLWTEVPRFETHPPLYYSLLKAWRILAGDSEFGLRLMSALVSIATLPILMSIAIVIGGKPHGRTAGLLAGLLFACSGTQLLASQDARPYTFLTFGMALTTLAVARIVSNPAQASRSLPTLLRHDAKAAADFVLLGVGVALMAWFHNLGTLFGIGTGLTLLIWWFVRGPSWRLLINLLIAALVAIVCYAPNLPVILIQVQAMNANGFWLKEPDLRAVATVLASLPFDISLDSGGIWRVTILLTGNVILLVLGVYAIAGLRGQASRDRSIAWILPAIAFVPVALSLLISFAFQPIFLDRTLQPAQVPALIMLGFAPLAVTRLRVPVMTALLALCALSVPLFHAEPRQTFFRDVARAIDESAPEARNVFVVPNSSALALDYYRHRLSVDMELHPLPAPFPAFGLNFTYPGGGGGVPGVDAETLKRLPQTAEEFPQVWLVMRDGSLFDPTHMVRNYLQEHYPCLQRELKGNGRRGDEVALLMARRLEDGSCPAL